jgi:formylglycine-generating enzyme required for sulfatase activity
MAERIVMILQGDPGTLTSNEQLALLSLSYEAGCVFKVFKTAKSGATVLILDTITERMGHNKPHVVKIQDGRQGRVEKQNHEAAARIVPGAILPKMVEHLDDESTGLSVTVYEIAGARILSIQPLSYYLEFQIARAETIIIEVADFLTKINPLQDRLRGRKTSGAFDLCKQVINHQKDRLNGPNGLAARLETILPGIGTRQTVAFNGISETFPNPVAYIYNKNLWMDTPLICPFGLTHGDLHSENILWNEADSCLSIIDWATFSTELPMFLDFALLEIDIVYRSLDCYTERYWTEWNNISKILGTNLASHDEAPKGVLAVSLWRLIKPIRESIYKQISNIENEFKEIFAAAYFLVLYSQTLILLRNKHIPTDRKIGLLLLSARYLNRALLGLGVEWHSKQPLIIPGAYEIGVRSQGTQRDLELEYIELVLTEWAESSRLYTALGGETNDQQIGHDHRMGVRMDVFYEILGQRQEELVSGSSTKPYEITDVLQEILCRKRVALLGDPGAGKSFTLGQLAHTLAQDARRDINAPIPVLIPLGGYSGETPLIDFLEQSTAGPIGKLRSEIRRLASEERLAFLLDGVNEIGSANKLDGCQEIIKLANNYPKAIFTVTCRSSECPSGIPLSRITIRPLDPLRVKTFLLNSLGNEAGEQLFWRLVDRDCQGRDQYWSRFQLGGGNEVDFWLARDQPEHMKSPWYPWDWDFWLKLRDSTRSYLSLARNPYMLSMITETYRATGVLPSNRGGLFKMFVDTLMAREKTKSEPSAWVEEKQQYISLSRLAYAVHCDHLGTSFERSYAVDKLGTPGMLDLAQNESILEIISGKVAFTHQLLQEFFAAYALDRERLETNLPAEQIWPKSEWWKPVGLEETSVILAGIYRENPLSVLEWLRDANPELAARCVVDGGIVISPEFRQLMIAAWLPRLTDIKEPIFARAAIGRALGLISGDIRPGVTYIDDNTGLPRFEWIHVPEGTVVRGIESSERRVDVRDFRVSKYLVTNAQYSAFVKDGGYTTDWKKCWTDTGWAKKMNARGPTDYSETLVLPNHPRIGINWYEAMAFCRWLDYRFQERGELTKNLQVRLPTETEWEKFARGTDSRRYPWGDQFDAQFCNVLNLESTTAVGIFPNGASPYGVCDVIGNAWKWCLTKWNPDEFSPEDNTVNGDSPRCYRGGSWGSNLWRSEPWLPSEIECHRRHWIVPEDDRPDAIGFFIVLGPKIF